MITHDELAKALYEAYRKERDMYLEAWDDLPDVQKKCWSAVANTAWELVEGENYEWAKMSANRAEDLAELIVEFINKAEGVLG
jgi:hypothetical protein